MKCTYKSNIELLNEIEEYEEEIERLNNIIKEAREYTKEAKEQDFMWTPIFMKELLKILDKGV